MYLDIIEEQVYLIMVTVLYNASGIFWAVQCNSALYCAKIPLTFSFLTHAICPKLGNWMTKWKEKFYVTFKFSIPTSSGFPWCIITTVVITPSPYIEFQQYEPYLEVETHYINFFHFVIQLLIIVLIYRNIFSPIAQVFFLYGLSL